MTNNPVEQMSEYWLTRVLRENAKRFKKLPRAIQEAKFSCDIDKGQPHD